MSKAKSIYLKLLAMMQIRTCGYHLCSCQSDKVNKINKKVHLFELSKINHFLIENSRDFIYTSSSYPFLTNS